jgi:dihydroorotate dehydrogenase
MPDWSYQTLFKPLLFKLQPRRARALTLGAMGRLSRLPGGKLLIKTLGHMEQAPMLASKLGGLELRYPVGIGGIVDPGGVATDALAQFGIGYMEIGPLTLEPVPERGAIRMDAAGEAIIYANEAAAANAGARHTAERLRERQRKRKRKASERHLPHLVRLMPAAAESPAAAAREAAEAAALLLPAADGLIVQAPLRSDWLPEEAASYYGQALKAIRAAGLPEQPMLLYLAAQSLEDKGVTSAWLKALDAQGWDGYVIGGERLLPDSGQMLVGRESKENVLDAIARMRRHVRAEAAIIAAGGIHEPQDALEAMQAGASYVQLDSGIVYAGPGLPKRINEAVIHARITEEAAPQLPSFWRNWGWMCLLGIGMIFGGLIAWFIAATSVLLPYDEAYLGVTRADIEALNHHLLMFMSHDRITLAGTMMSIGIFYYQLARHGLRHGQHWARIALLSSGIVGFSSFFLYLGYGYLDPLHAAAAAILLPMFLLAMNGLRDLPPRERPNLTNDPVWRRAQWGQLCWVALGFAFLLGGLVIAVIGITVVFVPTDLTFIGMSPAELADWNERLLPLIAHDRAGFGGALFSLAVAIAASALWGVGEGRRWLWNTFLIGGIPGFAAGFGVHIHIGYSNFWHLLPAYVAFALYVGGLILLYPYMMKRPRPM